MFNKFLISLIALLLISSCSTVSPDRLPASSTPMAETKIVKLYGPPTFVERGFSNNPNFQLFTEDGVFSMRFYCFYFIDRGRVLELYTTADPGNEPAFAQIKVENKEECQSITNELKDKVDANGFVELEFTDLEEFGKNQRYTNMTVK